MDLPPINPPPAPPTGGFAHFLATVEALAAAQPPTRAGTRAFVGELGAQCAHIQPADLHRPLRFLRQMAGNPPLRFGRDGFRPELVDDQNPARHYVAFVVVGYWLPMLLGLGVLYAWEVAGFVRYRGLWSQNDVRSGRVGLRHGRAVRRQGAQALPALLQRDVGIPAATRADARGNPASA